MSKTKKDNKYRIPISERAGRPIGTKRGQKGYDRKIDKQILRDIIKEDNIVNNPRRSD